LQKKAAEKKEAESSKAAIVQVDDLLSFRQFSKKAADDVIDVRTKTSCFKSFNLGYSNQYDEDVGRATGAAEVREDFISNLSRITQLTGMFTFTESSTVLIPQEAFPILSTLRHTSKFKASILYSVNKIEVRLSSL
jgi:hypothetical protein